MPTYTKTLGLKKTNMNTDGDDLFDFGDDLDNNWDKLDTTIATLINKQSFDGFMTVDLTIEKNSQMWINCNNTSAVAGTTGDERQNVGGYRAQANGTDIAIVQGYVGENAESGLQLITRKPDNSGYGAAVNLFTDVVGEKYFDFPKCTTPATTTSSASGSKAAVVVQNYVNGASWYRIWSDGWIEQGGYSKGGNTATSVTFLKPFANTNYTITLATNGTLGTNNNGICSIPEKTTSGFKLYSFSSYYCNWYACGY